MHLSEIYVSPQLLAFAERADVSPTRLALALADGDLAKHLDGDELSKLRASCMAPPVKPDLMRLLLGSM